MADREVETRITKCKFPTYCTDLCTKFRKKKKWKKLYCYPLLILFSYFTTIDVIFPFKCIFDNRLLNNWHLHTVWSETCQRTKEKLFCWTGTSLAERRRSDVTWLTGGFNQSVVCPFSLLSNRNPFCIVSGSCCNSCQRTRLFVKRVFLRV